MSDKCQIVCGLEDGTLKIWNIHTNKCVTIIKEHHTAVICCSRISDLNIVTGSKDQTLKIWNIQTGICEVTLMGHNETVKCCNVSNDGLIISGSNDNTLKIWNVKIDENNKYTVKCDDIRRAFRLDK